MSDADVLLGDVQRVRLRVRGFADWSPRKDTLALLEIVRVVLAEYAEYLPLTLRQIFYRLVGAHGYEKTEQAYERLGEHLVRARRARLIAMDAIRDDGGATDRPNMWASANEFLDTVRDRPRPRRCGAHAHHHRAGSARRYPNRVRVCPSAGVGRTG